MKISCLHIYVILHFYTNRIAMIDLLNPDHIVHVTATRDDDNRIAVGNTEEPESLECVAWHVIRASTCRIDFC